MERHTSVPSKRKLAKQQKLRARFLHLSRLPAKNLSEAEFIHRLRVTGKRLRAFLHLFTQTLGKNKAQAWDLKLSRTTTLLAASRNTQVLSELLTKLDENNLMLTGEEKKNLFPSSISGTSSSQTQKTVSVLKRARSILLRNALSSINTKMIRQQLKLSRKRFLKREKKSRHLISGPVLHQWRKSSKRLYYQLELAGRNSNKKEMKRLKKIEDGLGKIHDADELSVLLKKFLPDQKRAAIIERLQKRQKKQARQLRQFAKSL